MYVPCPALVGLALVFVGGCANPTTGTLGAESGSASTSAPPVGEDDAASAIEGGHAGGTSGKSVGEGVDAESGESGKAETMGDAAGETGTTVSRAPQDAASPADAFGAADANPANDPLNAAPQCTSKMTWTSGEDQSMRPGEACPTCHSNFQIAGTLYPTGHEPNDCDGVNGLSTNVTVVVTDATGQVFTLFPNQVGNFYTSITITPPFEAKVVANGKERDMGVSQTMGTCNTCHTPTGANGAPGRITLPE